MKKYDHKKTEKKWQKYWQENGTFEPDLKNPRGKGKFYNLMMFPYPSAEGLHIGNMYAFTGSDVFGRYMRMRGYDVFEPIGLDGFGIHSENYALKIGKHPAEQAKISEKNFYRQLEAMGNSFAWDEKLETYDPEYYKWTQWIFVQMFKNGLAYRKGATVNWCSSCLTVLADEQALHGECERCGTKIIKKELEQWFFRITKYTDRLLKNLDKIDWSEKIKIAQRNWIGKSEGTEIEFRIRNLELGIRVFTTRPDTVLGATYLVLAPEHPLILNLESRITNLEEVKEYIQKAKNKTEQERIAEGKEKTGVELTGIKAINPASGKEIPIWLADYVLPHYGTGAIMAVPAHDERDAQFAQKFDLPLGSGELINTESAIRKTGGKKTVNYRLRDWLISRQRYWGPPIPMIYCADCGWQPVPEEDLPVLLPRIEDFRPTGTDKSPLANSPEFYRTECHKCYGPARRETDVSDTFLDSAWYYLRYPSMNDKNTAWNKEITKQWLPVDMYIGGAEHAVLHLLYVRFLAMAMRDLGFLDFEEPMTRFRAHGLIIKDGAKMSKSKGNIVSPDEYIEKYGADVLRTFMMFIGPFDQGGDFREAGIVGIVRFQNRIWSKAHNLQADNSPEIIKKLNQAIKKVGKDIQELRFNTAISELMKLLAEMEGGGASRESFEIFLKLLSPLMPHMAEEIWQGVLGNSGSVHLQVWPKYDPTLVKEEMANFVIQINGRTRAVISLPASNSQGQVEKAALAEEKVRRHLSGKKPKKIIFVKDRLINFVF